MEHACKLVSILFIVLVLLISSFSSGLSTKLSSGLSNNSDIDPLVDLTVTVDILKIRSLEHDDPQLNVREVIDERSDPDFYVTLIINGQSFESDIFWNERYLYDHPFSKTVDVPDDQETVDIVIQLWDAADDGYQDDRLCDISNDVKSSSNVGTDDAYDVEITYNLKDGHWIGDDALKDNSGYGRLNGCDDGTIYEPDRDCELWFDISFNDYDNDKIPYYIETSVYGTDPYSNDADSDIDGDSVSTWWEWKWGYDPTVFDDHQNIDPENDGLHNLNEFRTHQWYSDPYVRDLFIELDQMEEGPNGEKCIFPEMAKEMLYTAHDRQNVIYHLDDGSWAGETGSEFVPFDEVTDWDELYAIRDNYFYGSAPQEWRRYVFHYGVLIWESSWVAGNAFGRNAFQISGNLLDLKTEEMRFDRDVVYASAYMHETGHNLNFWPIPGHGNTGWLLRIFLPLYKSCMSYGWIYRMVDYSDGSRPFLGPTIGDYDDWERMDLTNFLRN